MIVLTLTGIDCVLDFFDCPHTTAKNHRFSFRCGVFDQWNLNWEIAQELLSETGFTLERAENGKICVEKFQSSQVGTYDVILMDIRMPVMDGYGAATAIRALDRPDAGLPIIAMTADAFSEDIQRSLECGMNAHVAKPIDVNQLLSQLKKYLK